MDVEQSKEKPCTPGLKPASKRGRENSLSDEDEQAFRAAATSIKIARNNSPDSPVIPDRVDLCSDSSCDSSSESIGSGSSEQGSFQGPECANCQSVVHELSHCPWPANKDGFLLGCPPCNEQNHSFDECRLSSPWKLPPRVIFRYLVLNRAGLPPVKSSVNLFLLAAHLDQVQELYDNLPLAVGTVRKVQGVCDSSCLPRG